MASNAQYASFTHKKLIGSQDLGEWLLGYLRESIREFIEIQHPDDGVFDTALVLAADGNDKFQVTGASKCTDADGHLMDPVASGEAAGVQFENESAILYYVGIEHAVKPSGISINPRTGLPEYTLNEETIGKRADPGTVTDQTTTIKLIIDSVSESGVDHTGRQCMVFMKTPAAGALTELIAIETLTVQFAAGENFIVTADLLGQTTVSTTSSDYEVILLGPRVSRGTDLEPVDGTCFLGTVTGAGAGNPPVTFATGSQNVIDTNATFTDITRVDTHGETKIEVQGDTSDVDENQIRVKDFAGNTTWSVNEDGAQAIALNTTDKKAIDITEDAVARATIMVNMTRDALATGDLMRLFNKGHGDALSVYVNTSEDAVGLAVYDSDTPAGRSVPLVKIVRQALPTGDALNVQGGNGAVIRTSTIGASLGAQLLVHTESNGARTAHMIDLTREVLTLGDVFRITHKGSGDAFNVALSDSTGGQVLVVTEDSVARDAPMVVMTRDALATSTAHIFDLNNSGDGDTFNISHATSLVNALLKYTEDNVARNSNLIEILRQPLITGNTFKVDHDGSGRFLDLDMGSALGSTAIAIDISESNVARTADIIQIIRGSNSTGIAINVHMGGGSGNALDINMGGGSGSALSANGAILLDATTHTGPLVNIVRKDDDDPTPITTWRDSGDKVKNYIDSNGFLDGQVIREWYQCPSGISYSATSGFVVTDRTAAVADTNCTFSTSTSGIYPWVMAELLVENAAVSQDCRQYSANAAGAFGHVIGALDTMVAVWEQEIALSVVGVADEMSFYFGYHDDGDGASLSAPSSHRFAMFRKIDGDTNWQCITGNNAATGSIADSGVPPVASEFQILRIEYHGLSTPLGVENAGIATVLFFIDGVQVAEIVNATHVPSGANPLGWVDFAGAGATGPTLNVRSYLGPVALTYGPRSSNSYSPSL